MLFQLPTFLLFLLVFAALLALCPRSWVQPYVLAASLFFYAWWYPPYVVILLVLMVATWAMANLVWRRPAMLPLTIIVALIPLAFYKYTDFVLRTVGALVNAELPQLGLVLPLGISFITFTIISVLVDTSRSRSEPPPGFLKLGVYITFFPHLIAGPILRMRQVVSQLDDIRIDWPRLVPNLGLFAVGMMKKVLIADPIGAYVDSAYGNVGQLSGGEALLAILGFSIQIYCDFAAYSDMAIALAGMFGVAFPENFKSPYASASMGEVWRRWHMTLSFWLRDYVFKPLHRTLHQFSRYYALVLTMLVSGLWHGAGWTFVLWGGATGVLMTAEHLTGYSRFSAAARGPKLWACTALTFVEWSLLLVLFRASSLHDAQAMLASAIGLHGWAVWPAEAGLILGLCALTLAIHTRDQVDMIRGAVARIPVALSLPLALMIISTCAILAAGRPQNFYYFDF